MNRQQKSVIIDEIQKLHTESVATFLVEYKGLNVADMQGLRKHLRGDLGVVKVAKTTLMKRALKGVDGIEDFSKHLKTQVGLVFAKGEVSTIAKKLVNFAKDHELMQIISGFFETKTLSKKEIETLATLPSRELLLAQLAGTLQAPIAALVRLFYTLLARLVYVLQQISEKKLA
jgi:large subunit ribosomal protein L10